MPDIIRPIFSGMGTEYRVLDRCAGQANSEYRSSFTYRTESCQLAPGDGLFVYTDGITEALNSTNEPVFEERLEEALGALSAASASEMVSGVMKSVRTFAANAVQADDIAAMGLRFVK